MIIIRGWQGLYDIENISLYEVIENSGQMQLRVAFSGPNDRYLLATDNGYRQCSQ